MKKIVSVFLSLIILAGLLPTVYVYSAQTSFTKHNYLQSDSRWRYLRYNNSYLQASGCGILSIVNAVYNCTGLFIEPKAVADWAYAKRYFNQSSSGGGGICNNAVFFRSADEFGNDYNFKVVGGGSGSSSSLALKNHVMNEGTAIVHVPGHYMCLVDYDASSGKYLVFDCAPGSGSNYNSINRAGLTTAGGDWKTISELNKGYLKIDGYWLFSPLDNSVVNAYDTITYDASLQVTCSSKSVKSAPYSSSGTTRMVYDGDIINVIGYLYNEYGNLWYKTDAGDYIYSSYLKAINYNTFPPSNYCNAAFEVTCSSKTIRSDPYASGDALGTVSRGETVIVCGYLYNRYGNLWYETTSGGFIYCNYLSVISSDSRTPSNYIDVQLEVMASSKALREDPYSDSETIGSVDRNSIVKIKGYLYNRYGNLWYMTDSEAYLYSSYLLQTSPDQAIPSNYENTDYLLFTGEDRKAQPYSISESADYVSTNTIINTIGYVINLNGEKWYECRDDCFISSNSANPLLCMIEYDANGGVGAPPLQNYTYALNGTTTLSSIVPSKTGYSFLGWSLDNTANSPSYAAGQEWGLNNYGNFTLYAIWKPTEFVIQYHDNGGSGGPISQVKYYGVDLVLSTVKPTKTYTIKYEPNGGNLSLDNKSVSLSFSSWNEQPDATGENYYPGGVYGKNLSTTLYAIWENPIAGSLETPSKPGFSFEGWFTSAEGGTQITALSPLIGDITLYAHWMENCELGHNFSYNIRVIPSFDTVGAIVGTCLRCGEEQTISLPELNTIDYTYSISKEAACTSSGIGTYVWNNTEYGAFSFDVAIPQVGHAFDHYEISPTCVNYGYTTHRCSRCGESYVDSYVAALGHAYENGYCVRCGEQDPDFEAAPAPIVISDLDIRSNISLGAELVVNYRLVNNAAFKAYGFDRFWMEFVRHNLDGTDSTTRYGEGQEAALVVNGARSFDLKNRSIPAAELGVGYTVRFHGMKGDQEYVTEPITSSMKDYFVSILETVEPEDNRGEEQLRLAADTLLYAAKAQTVFGIDPEHPILAGLSEAAQTQLEDYGDRAAPAAENHIAFLGEGLTKPVIRLSLQDRLEVTIRYTSSSSAGLENVQVQFWPDGDESAKQCIPASLNGRTWTAVCSDIGAGRVKDLYHFVVLAEGAPISSEAIWSVESYVAASRDSAEASMRELLNAVLNYGLAVINAF